MDTIPDHSSDEYLRGWVGRRAGESDPTASLSVVGANATSYPGQVRGMQGSKFSARHEGWSRASPRPQRNIPPADPAVRVAGRAVSRRWIPQEAV